MSWFPLCTLLITTTTPCKQSFNWAHPSLLYHPWLGLCFHHVEKFHLTEILPEGDWRWGFPVSFLNSLYRLFSWLPYLSLLNNNLRNNMRWCWKGSSRRPARRSLIEDILYIFLWNMARWEISLSLVNSRFMCVCGSGWGWGVCARVF